MRKTHFQGGQEGCGAKRCMGMLHGLSALGAYTGPAPGFCRLVAANMVSTMWCCPNPTDPQERLGVEQGWWGLPHMELSHGTHLAAPHRFITRKGREVCANPEHDWVKKYVTELELN